MNKTKWIEGKRVCSECRYQAYYQELLSAESPFESGVAIYACPRCKCVEKLEPVCMYPNCWGISCCGFEDGSEFVFTCQRHAE
jgi:hypothetical protein